MSVGTSGAAAERLALVTPSARRRPLFTCGSAEGESRDHHLYLASDQIGQRGPGAFVRHVDHVDLETVLEHFAGEMRARARARGSERKLARIARA
jgi:hypothetical protein